MATYFYQRISTKESTDKQSFQRQDKSLKAYAEKNNLDYNGRTVFKDDVTGATFDRPDWIALVGNGKNEEDKDYKSGIIKEGDTIVFKEISRFTREAEEGYKKYMELKNKGINLVFIDNPTVSTDYINQLMGVAQEQQLVAKTALESTVKLLLIVELDRVQQEREIISKRITQGIKASNKEQGRKNGQLDKITPELEQDIRAYINDRSIKQVDVMRKHNISRNTFKKYVECVKNNKVVYKKNK